MNALQSRIIGHAALVLLAGLLAGFGLTMSLVGGLEVFPGAIISISLPGEPAGWARAHAGGLMNALLMIAVALLFNVLDFAESRIRRLTWMLIGTGWANTLFYWMALLAPNRAITLGNNRWGEANLAAVVGFVPAFIFAFVMVYVALAIASAAFQGASKNDTGP